MDPFQELQQRVRRLQLYAAVLTLASLVLAVAALRPQKSAILRVRGLIIEADAGRDRILIGPPIPAARGRVGTDSALAHKAGAEFPARVLGLFTRSLAPARAAMTRGREAGRCWVDRCR